MVQNVIRRRDSGIDCTARNRPVVYESNWGWVQSIPIESTRRHFERMLRKLAIAPSVAHWTLFVLDIRGSLNMIRQGSCRGLRHGSIETPNGQAIGRTYGAQQGGAPPRRAGCRSCIDFAETSRRVDEPASEDAKATRRRRPLPQICPNLRWANRIRTDRGFGMERSADQRARQQRERDTRSRRRFVARNYGYQ